MGTTAASTSPLRTMSRAAITDAAGIWAASVRCDRLRTALSANVASGPK